MPVKALHIRGVEDEVVKWLKVEGAKAGVSMEEQARRVLRQGMGRPTQRQRGVRGKVGRDVVPGEPTGNVGGLEPEAGCGGETKGPLPGSRSGDHAAQQATTPAPRHIRRKKVECPKCHGRQKFCTECDGRGTVWD